MARLQLDLGGLPWLFGQAPSQPFSANPRDDRGAVTSWHSARVPGDVRADLISIGWIASLDTPEDITKSAWVDESDWWWRTEIPASEPGMTTVLEADGVDYLSALFLDGELLATHQGMFARQVVVLPPMPAFGRHELAVRLWGAHALPRLPESSTRRVVRKLLTSVGVAAEYFPDRMAVPKAQFSFGWDFSPRVLSTGIWDDIRLVHCRGAYLAGIHAIPEPLADRDDPTPVRWTVRLCISRFIDTPLTATVELRDNQGELIPLPDTTFALGRGENPSFAFNAPALARWWPWDQGEPQLYYLTVRLIDGRGMVADEAETVVGIRTVHRQRFSNAAPWRFTINGRPVFLRGANWVPVDILPGRASVEAYENLVGLARSAGINFLRVWGGGIREKAAFWEQCNRAGIMAMQEFPLACAFLDHYPRGPQYLSVLESEAAGIVRNLRNHPSLIAWCGGNEISPRRERLPLRTIEHVLRREDVTRPWIPASPSDGDVHQWDVWHGRAPWQSLAQVRAPFMSEFGLQALPVEATVREMFPSGPPTSLEDGRWLARKLQAAKLLHYAGPLPEGNLVATIEATQRTQAAALQAGIEGCRLRREGSGRRHPCGGVAFWQFNEPWAVVSWSVVDKCGRPKAAYEMLVRSYQPVLVAAQFARRKWMRDELFRADIWLVNDGYERLNGVNVRAALDGTVVCTCDNVNVLPGSATPVVSLAVQLERPPTLLELTCLRDDVHIAWNRYDLDVYLPPPQPLLAWLMRRAADALLR